MDRRNTPPVLDRKFVAKDELIIKEGEFGQQAYLIQSGEVVVYLGKEGQEVELARLGAGQFVGEMAFIFDGPRTASVRALMDCNLIIISRPQFEEKLRGSDATVRAIVHMLSKRIIDSNNALMNKKSDFNDLKETARQVYENISVKLSPNQRRNLQNTVLPHLEAMLESIDTFQDRYGDQPE